MNEPKKDQLSAARGILNGVCFSAVLWALFIVLLMLVRV